MCVDPWAVPLIISMYSLAHSTGTDGCLYLMCDISQGYSDEKEGETPMTASSSLLLHVTSLILFPLKYSKLLKVIYSVNDVISIAQHKAGPSHHRTKKKKPAHRTPLCLNLSFQTEKKGRVELRGLNTNETNDRHSRIAFKLDT